MAYNDKALSRQSVGAAHEVGVGNATSEWRYNTADVPVVVETAGYWNGARSRLVKGDVISAVMTITGATPIHKRYVILTVPATGNITFAVQSTALG